MLIFGYLTLLGIIGIAAFLVLLIIYRLLQIHLLGQLINQVIPHWSRFNLQLAFIVSLLAAGGSLYMSEILVFIPCELCWYQRIAMYPIPVILVTGLWKKDYTARVYAAILAIIGFGIALYHFSLQSFPQLISSCSSLGVACNTRYVELFNFISIPIMSLTAFTLILITLYGADLLGTPKSE